MSLKKNIPNGVTVLNLLSGSVSIIVAFSGNLYAAGWLIFLAAFFDLADGLLARMLNARSKIGGVLDSLADVISFGLAPAMIVFQLLRISQPDYIFIAGKYPLLPFVSLLIVVVAAIRLAKFTVDESQVSAFKGMPTPAAAIYFAALPMMEGSDIWPAELAYNKWFLISSVVVASFLMLSRLPMISMKFKNLSWRDNASRYILTGISLILFFLLNTSSVPLIIFAYVLVSLIAGKDKEQIS